MFSIRLSPVLKYSSPEQNAFASNIKNARPQHKTRSSLALNLFVGSESYLEVSTRDYLVASNERAHLQYEIMFRRERQRLGTSLPINNFFSSIWKLV